MSSKEKNSIKKAVAQKACEFIHNDMVVGIGSGSTVEYFVEALGLICQRGLKIHAVASSSAIYELALKWHIPMIDYGEVTNIDLTVDGADEIDEQKFMIKGGGGALFREKILASSSQEMIVIIDDSKLSKSLGNRKLPIEIHPFCYRASIKKINQAGFKGSLRVHQENGLYITDNGNYIYDVSYPNDKNQPMEDHETLIQIPGVIETGLFCHLSPKVLMGRSSQEIEIW